MRTAKCIWTITFLAIITWLVASWGNVLAHHMSDCCYAWWNAFTIIF